MSTESECVESVLDSSGVDATTAAAVALCSRLAQQQEVSKFSDFSSVWDWASVGGVLCCVSLAALAAGLTMGIVGIEALDLRVKLRTGDASERNFARRLLPLVERNPHHQVLVTLLLVNSVANEALPLFLDQLVPSWCAILLSVSAVLLLGEVLPSAAFAGASRIRLASAFVPLVSFFIVLVSPIAYPLSVLLDRFMPEVTQFTTRQELHAMVEVERDLAAELHEKEPFTENESKLVLGTLSLAQKKIEDVMVPIDRVFTVNQDALCEKDTKTSLAVAGYSRVPLRTNNKDDDKFGSPTQYILVKELLLSEDVVPLRQTRAVREPLWVRQDDSLYSLLHQFQSGQSHIAFVHDTTGDVVGIVTLEDIIEEIMDEIYDETDLNVASSKIAQFFRTMTNNRQDQETKSGLLKRQLSRRLAPRRQESRGGSDERQNRKEEEEEDDTETRLLVSPRKKVRVTTNTSYSALEVGGSMV